MNTVGGFVRFSQMNTDVHSHRFGRVINRFIHLRADQAGAGTICTGKKGLVVVFILLRNWNAKCHIGAIYW
jgi:hypothetical protein